MPISGNFDQALPTRQPLTIRTGEVFERTEIVGGNGITQGPHAYLVEQSAGVLLPSHFHMSDQFQVVLGGTGTLGRHHALKPVTVHYARAQSAYGPIVADSEGLAYLTLRGAVEYGAHYLADPKTRIDRELPKFQRTSDWVAVAQATELAALKIARHQALIPEADDGLAVWMAWMPAGAPCTMPAAQANAGRFHVVVAGTVLVEAEAFPLWSCIWTAPGELLTSIRAGSGGAELLSLQFPKNNSEAKREGA